jgi:hypothetical protein
MARNLAKYIPYYDGPIVDQAMMEEAYQSIVGGSKYWQGPPTCPFPRIEVSFLYQKSAVENVDEFLKYFITRSLQEKMLKGELKEDEEKKKSDPVMDTEKKKSDPVMDKSVADSSLSLIPPAPPRYVPYTVPQLRDYMLSTLIPFFAGNFIPDKEWADSVRGKMGKLVKRFGKPTDDFRRRFNDICDDFERRIKSFEEEKKEKKKETSAASPVVESAAASKEEDSAKRPKDACIDRESLSAIEEYAYNYITNRKRGYLDPPFREYHLLLANMSQSRKAKLRDLAMYEQTLTQLFEMSHLAIFLPEEIIQGIMDKEKAAFKRLYEAAQSRMYIVHRDGDMPKAAVEEMDKRFKEEVLEGEVAPDLEHDMGDITDPDLLY